ncbi:universal stress protein [Spirillospora sp. NPDC048819]|uniref:universal stress protein n=1 Tax=Spirillospora sp. NPDC048819 TaxID=3155268 RepID=UPI0033EA1447
MSKIIVGLDGSEPSLLAIDWAAGEAARRGASLHVVYIVTPGSSTSQQIRAPRRSGKRCCTTGRASSTSVSPALACGCPAWR